MTKFHKSLGGFFETASGRHAVKIDRGCVVIAEAKYYREITEMELWAAEELADLLQWVAKNQLLPNTVVSRPPGAHEETAGPSGSA